MPDTQRAADPQIPARGSPLAIARHPLAHRLLVFTIAGGFWGLLVGFTAAQSRETGDYRLSDTRGLNGAPAVLQPPPLVPLADPNEDNSRTLPADSAVLAPQASRGTGAPNLSNPVAPRRRRPGDDLLGEVVRSVESRDSIRAVLSQQVEIFGQSLMGRGAYQQSRRDEQILMRLDLQLQLDGRPAIMQQICDGRFLWDFRESPDNHNPGSFTRRLSRVDLQPVRKASGAAQGPQTMLNMSIGYGGLPQMLRGLGDRFTFDVPHSAVLHQVPVWVLDGEWYEPELRRLAASLKKDVETPNTNPPRRDPTTESKQALLRRLPSQMPQKVQLTIGKEDLFPYRIDYLRFKESRGKVMTKPRSLVRLDLFQVEFDKQIDPSQFFRQAGDLRVEDATAEFMIKHGLTQAER